MSSVNVAADQLRLFIERIERLEDEKREMSDDIKDVYLEAKSQGYDPKTMRACVRLRKMEKAAREEAEALLETYKAALGMASVSTPLFPEHDGRPDPSMPPPAPSASSEELYLAAVSAVTTNGKASPSWLQRQLRIGYHAAARLIERMERDRIVGPPDHGGRREILVDAAAAGAAIAAGDLHRLADKMAADGTTVSIRVAVMEPVVLGTASSSMAVG